MIRLPTGCPKEEKMNPEMTEITKNDRVAKLLGIRLVEVDIGYALA